MKRQTIHILFCNDGDGDYIEGVYADRMSVDAAILTDMAHNPTASRRTEEREVQKLGD